MPNAVLADLQADPERFSLKCLRVLQYAEAHAVYRRKSPHELKAWSRSDMLKTVTRIDAEIVAEEMGLPAEVLEEDEETDEAEPVGEEEE